jgi:predicted CoA-substrate-specific enzyme activase
MNYNTKEFAGSGSWKFKHDRPVVGLDLGSRASKGVLLTSSKIYTTLIPTGLYMQETADELLKKLLRLARVKRSELGYIVSTGYGRISLSFDDIAFEVVTEISCHAMGAHALYPSTRTIIDIGGQDSKAIKVDTDTGKVVEFVMNDKCAAGTGQFLEKAAVLLGLTLDELGAYSLKSTNPAQISSQCVVFAESEMISLRAKGAKVNDSDAVANIAAGIHYSAARRVRNLLGRVGSEPGLLFTGGVSNNPGMRRILEELIGSPFTETTFDMIYAGALGAAAYATQHASRERAAEDSVHEFRGVDLLPVTELIEQQQEAFIDPKNDDIKVGYLCTYTPLELLGAAGVKHARLFKAGSPDIVAAGERYTQSVFCDFSKSCIGGFEGDPLYKALDKVYNFHTCGSMKRASEVIEQYVPVKLLNLPKLRDSQASRKFFRDEIVAFRDDLVALTGREISENSVRVQIDLYNTLRQQLKQFSELRKRSHPPPVRQRVPGAGAGLLLRAGRGTAAGIPGPLPAFKRRPGPGRERQAAADDRREHRGGRGPAAFGHHREGTRSAGRGRGPLYRAQALLSHDHRAGRPVPDPRGRLSGPGTLRAHEVTGSKRGVLRPASPGI